MFGQPNEILGKRFDVFLVELINQAHLTSNYHALVESVQLISNSVLESSQAISQSAESSQEIVGGIKKITEAIDRNNEVTEQLSDTTQKFTML